MDDLLPALKRGEPTGRPESAPCADGADAQAFTFELMLTLTLTLTLNLTGVPFTQGISLTPTLTAQAVTLELLPRRSVPAKAAERVTARL